MPLAPAVAAKSIRSAVEKMHKEKIIVPGFRASAMSVGLKKAKALDLAMIVSEIPSTAAAVFTTNKVKAAPVLVSREHLRDGRIRAVIANAGNANACTGEEGLTNARKTAEMTAEALGVDTAEVVVASTGVIGAPLDMTLITPAIPELVRALDPEGIGRVADAIMTTDSFPKISRYQGVAGGNPYRILGVAKGAGMIMPHMATMLCFVISDIMIEEEELQNALSESVAGTFNRISVDGDTSTNDMVLVMANGFAKNDPLTAVEYQDFREGLTSVMAGLAKMIVKDGEGATKVIQVHVRGAASADEAEAAARTIANSSLVKTAFYGQDPNWGRIMAALGRSGIRMKEEAVSIWINDVRIVEGGLGVGTTAEQKAAGIMKQEEYTLIVDLHSGPFEDRIITCDLTHEYVSINADYRT